MVYADIGQLAVLPVFKFEAERHRREIFLLFSSTCFIRRRRGRGRIFLTSVVVRP
jgi:hypothetical protein